MIEYIKGSLSEATEHYIVVDNTGLGYKIYISRNFFVKLPALSSDIKVYTHLLHKDDIMELYGFDRLFDRIIFRELIKVSGVGTKLAIKMQSSCSSEEIVSYIIKKDVKNLSSRVKGLGRRTSDKIMIELSDRFLKLYTLDEELRTDYDLLAFDALLSLGYKDNEIRAAFDAISTVKDSGETEDLIKEALKWLVDR